MSIAADVDQLRDTWVELGMASKMADELGADLQQRGRDFDAIIDEASTLRHLHTDGVILRVPAFFPPFGDPIRSRVARFREKMSLFRMPRLANP